MLEKKLQPTEIWECDPLLVVHAEDGIVFSGKTRAECIPDDRSGRSGRIRSLTPSADGWSPNLVFTQRVEMLQTMDFRVERRRGLILMGNDETGELFTWYINGEADRFLLAAQDVSAPVAIQANLDRALGSRETVRLLFVERADGYCPFNGRTEILRVPYLTGEVVEFVEAATLGEDGRLPSIYVMEETLYGDGRIWTGYDSDDFAVTWYLNEAAEALPEGLS